MRTAETTRTLLLLPLVPTLALGIVELVDREPPAPVVTVETAPEAAVSRCMTLEEHELLDRPPVTTIYIPRDQPPLVQLEPITLSTVSF